MDRMNESNEYEIGGFNDEIADSFSKNVDKEAVAAQVRELRNDPNDMENVFNKFNREFPRVKEEELDAQGKTVIDDSVRIVVKRAYCPECGREIVSSVPLMFNPYTMEKIAKYECSCGAKFNFEHSYPRIVYYDSKGNEIKVFAD
jgi:hypothetical protein